MEVENDTKIASISSSGESFLDSLRAFFSSAFAVFFSVFSLPFPGFFVFFPIFTTAASSGRVKQRLYKRRRWVLMVSFCNGIDETHRFLCLTKPSPTTRNLAGDLWIGLRLINRCVGFPEWALMAQNLSGSILVWIGANPFVLGR